MVGEKILAKCFKADGNGGLQLDQTEIREPNDSEVLIKIAAFGVNRADLLQLKGLYPPPKNESDILGLEYSGEVISVGRKVTLVKVGQFVAGLCGSGAYAEYIIAHEKLIMLLPDTIDLIAAAGMPEVFGTAFYNLFILNSIKKGQKVLIHSAGGGVGLAAIQLLTEARVEVHAVVGSDEKVQKLGKFNVAKIYNYKNDGYELLELGHKNSFDFILDTVGGSLLALHVALLREQGKIQNIGMLGGSEGKFDFANFLKKNLHISSSTLRNKSLEVKAELCDNLTRHVIEKVADGRLSLNIYEIFETPDINRAFEILRNNENFGKIIVRW